MSRTELTELMRLREIPTSRPRVGYVHRNPSLGVEPRTLTLGGSSLSVFEGKDPCGWSRTNDLTRMKRLLYRLSCTGEAG